MWRGLAFLLCVFAAAPAWAQSPPPVEAFGALPAIVDVAMSRDGSRVAVARTSEGRWFVEVVNLDSNETLAPAVLSDDHRLYAVNWADDDTVSFLLGRIFRPGEVLPIHVRFRGAPRRVEYRRWAVMRPGSSETLFLSTNPDELWRDQGARLIAPIDGDPGYARMIGRSNDADATHSTVYRIDLDSARVREVRPRGVNNDTISFLLDERGAPIARLDSDRPTNRWSVHVYDGETPRLLAADISRFGDPLALQGLLPDGRLAAIDFPPDGDVAALFAIDRTSGQREILFQRERHDIDDAIFDPWLRRVVGARWVESEESQHFFDPALAAIYEQARAALPDAALTLESWSADRRRVVVYAEHGLDGGAYYIFTPATNEFARLRRRYPAMETAARGSRLEINYRARDGQRIPAYLTLPRGGEDARNLPLVLLVHGGPASRDTLGFDWWAAFLASRGYAVLQPNFRGSSGYGRAWEEAGWGQWGGLMQTDVEDGVAALSRAGRIDPARVCIVGASYGGYAALAGATLTPDRYRCAVSVAGVSDLPEMLLRNAAISGQDSMSADYWRTSIGDRRAQRDELRAISPAFLAGGVQIPILLMHGTDDTVVPIDQSRRMYRALTEAGKNVRFVELRGDDHYLSDAPTRLQMLQELETFLEQHLASN